MNDDCCNNRQNFGHPNCGLGVFSNIVKPIFVPLTDSSGVPFVYSLDSLTFDTLEAAYIAQLQADRFYGFPTLENFTWEQADSLTEETSSGAKFFLREGVISVKGELFKKDATPTMKGKISAMRCNEWGVLFVTNNNQVIGKEEHSVSLITGFESDLFAPIPISNESIDGIFAPSQDTTSQKIMFAFDLDRNFDTSTLYMIDGDEVVDAAGNSKPFNFLDPISVVDCHLDTLVTGITTDFVTVVIEDDYRQGFRPSGVNGNVTGLTISDFIVTVQTGAVITPLTVVESADGVYDFTFTPLDLGTNDVCTITMALTGTDPTYNGNISYIVP